MSPEIQYDDFEIEVRSIGKKRYKARVLSSPRGDRPESRFIPPYAAEKLGDILSALEGCVRSSASAGRDLVWEEGSPTPMTSVEVEELGGKLFQSLFQGNVERRLRESMGIVQEKGGDPRSRGLRLRVTFDREEDFTVLATLPWELLWDQGQFINRSRLTPVVRSINTPRSRKPVLTGEFLRVLLIPSNPRDLSFLQTGKESQLVKKALANHPRIKTETWKHPDIRELRKQVLDGGHHIVHFMGHGGHPDDGSNNFVLFFEGRGGRAEPVTGLQLAESLQDIPSLQLVVLNSCWSGAFQRREGTNAFTTIAVDLIVRGTPAVVAMQFPISDTAAIAFSKVFYERIAQGEAVSAAVTEGRLAITHLEPDSLEWVTPVTFLAGDDRLFDVAAERERLPTDSPSSGPSPLQNSGTAAPLRLAIRSFQDPYLGDNQTPDALLDLTPFFNGRYIKEAALWQTEVYPRLAEFLQRYEKERTPLVLDFAAHLTIAFAAGYCLEAKSGLQTTVLQRSQRGVDRWKAEAGPARPGPLWRDEADLALSPKSAAVALAIGATHDITDDVNFYLKKSRRAVGRLVPATIYPQPSSTSVEDGQHALQLAQDLSLKIRQRSFEERRRPLHLFAASPNAVLFFLGQLSRSFGAIQLYEHDFPAKKPGAYIPSLLLPVP